MNYDNLNRQGLLDSRFLEKNYREALELTQEVALFLEQETADQKNRLLPPDVKVFHASESMRITTRLMQVVSWLLVQKGVANGEMTKDEARVDKYRLGSRDVCLREAGSPPPQVTEKFKSYLSQTKNLYHRTARMDEMVYGQDSLENPVHKLMDRLTSED